MRRLIRIAAFLVFPSAIGVPPARMNAQQIPNPVTSGDSFDISGTVINSVTAEPVPAASVSLTPADGRDGTRSTTAGASGEFRLPRVPVGAYRLASTKRGYAEGVDSFKKVILVGGTQPSQFQLQLNPESVITGFVRGGGKLPVPDAAVVVVRTSIVAGHRRLEARESAKTDAQGRFRFAGLGPGPCLVVAMPPPSPDMKRTGLGYPPTFYPNSTESATAQVIDLRPGAAQDLEIAASPLPAFTIRGVVSGARRNLNFALTSLSEATSAIHPAANVQFDESTGAYSIANVPPGNYLLEAFDPDNETVRASAFQTVSVSGHDLPQVNLSLTQGPSLRGDVRVSDGSASVLSSVGVQSLFDSYGGRVNPSTGEFAIANGARPGKYRIVLEAAPGWFLASATQGGRDVTRGDLRIGEDAATPSVTVNVSKAGATIEATVTWPEDGPRKPAIVTVLEQSDGEMRLVAETRVMPPNPPAVLRPALLGGLPAGNFVAYAWPEPVTVEYAVLEQLRPYDSFAQSVTIGEGELTRIALKVAPAP